MRALVLVTALSPALAGSVHGQAERLALGDRVRVTVGIPLSERIVATLEGVQGDTLVLALNGGAVRRVPIDTVERLEVSRGRHRKTWSGAGFGFLAGAGAGALLGVLVSCDDSSECLRPGDVVPASTLAVGVVGGLVGALVGSLTETDTWEEVPLDRPGEVRLAAQDAVVVAPSRAADTGGQGRRRGMWGGVGAGAGWDATTKEAEAPFSISGPAAYGRAGATASPHLLVGGEVAGWRGSHADEWWVSTNALLTALVYPSNQGNVFVKVGMGLALQAERLPAYAAISDVNWHAGFGAELGVGYDIPIGRAMALTPNVDVLFQTATDWGLALLLTVGLTWH